MAAIVIVDPWFPQHRKTLRFRALMDGSPTAPFYLVNLWSWALRQNLLDGRIPLKVDVAPAVDMAVDCPPWDGRCCRAMVESGFLDVTPDGTLQIHDWMDWTGREIARLQTQALSKAARRKRYGRDWDKVRMAILQRDGFSCVSCDARSDLDVHHIKPAAEFESPEAANVESNLVTLCGVCHGTADSAERARKKGHR